MPKMKIEDVDLENGTVRILWDDEISLNYEIPDDPDGNVPAVQDLKRWAAQHYPARTLTKKRRARLGRYNSLAALTGQELDISQKVEESGNVVLP